MYKIVMFEKYKCHNIMKSIKNQMSLVNIQTVVTCFILFYFPQKQSDILFKFLSIYSKQVLQEKIVYCNQKKIIAITLDLLQ